MVVVAATQPKLYMYPVVPVKYCRHPVGGFSMLEHSIWVTWAIAQSVLQSTISIDKEISTI